MSREEKEIKIELKIPVEEFLNRARKLGFKDKKKIIQVDKYFDTPDWALYKSVAAMRIRQVDGVDHSFAFKKVFNLPTRKNKHYVEEVEDVFPLIDKVKLTDIFKRLKVDHDGDGIIDSTSLTDVLVKYGWQDEQVMKKTRNSLVDDNNNEIVVDHIDGIGTVVELECETDDPHELVKKLLKLSEWTRSIIGTSYIWLEKHKGFDLHNQYPQMFDEKPDWNVWDNEREMYENLVNSH